MIGRTERTALFTLKRPRFRIGIRGLIGVVLLLGVGFGSLARMRREAVQREALVAELARDRILVNSREPTLLCLVLTKLRGSREILPGTPAAFESWLSPGWFSRPVGFNAGRLPDAETPRVVERLRRLGDVHEVEFHGGSLNGLKLFYINRIPHYQFGPEGRARTFRSYPAAGSALGPSRDPKIKPRTQDPGSRTQDQATQVLGMACFERNLGAHPDVLGNRVARDYNKGWRNPSA
ncbi:MAG: hypothetical protein AB7I30_10615 [Isosphaeraceae bacterium]